MTHRYTPPKNKESSTAPKTPIVGDGLEIKLPIHDLAFTNRSLLLAKQVRHQGIRGIEIRIPGHELADAPDISKYRSPSIRLLARKLLRDACRDFPTLAQAPVSEVVGQIIENVPELEEPMQITLDSVKAPVDKQSGERFVLLTPSRDDMEYLVDVRNNVYDAILDASGVLLRPNNRPVDLTVAYAHDFVDFRTSESLARAYGQSLPLEINFNPAIFNPDTRQA